MQQAQEKREMTVREFASLGGKARARSLTSEQRSEIARKAGKAPRKKAARQDDKTVM